MWRRASRKSKGSHRRERSSEQLMRTRSAQDTSTPCPPSPALQADPAGPGARARNSAPPRHPLQRKVLTAMEFHPRRPRRRVSSPPARMAAPPPPPHKVPPRVADPSKDLFALDGRRTRLPYLAEQRWARSGLHRLQICADLRGHLSAQSALIAGGSCGRSKSAPPNGPTPADSAD